MPNRTRLEIPLNVRKVIESFRDSGYRFETAIANIVDNSIDAGATLVQIVIERDADGEGAVMISDNGRGMDEATLYTALKYGSETPASEDRLGKYGLGLKTATTGFCTQLTVITRTGPNDQVRCAMLDLHHIAEAGRMEYDFWEGEPYERRLLGNISPNSSGTVILWGNIDRLFKNRVGTRAGTGELTRLVNNLDTHLSEVFCRYLDPEDSRAPNLVIEINGVAVEPFDIFCINEEHYTAATDAELSVEGTEGSILVQGHILPTRHQFSTPEAYKKARVTSGNQGIYFFRNNRLMAGGDWYGIRADHPMLAGTRIEVNIMGIADSSGLIQLDYKKSQIGMHPDLYDQLKAFAAPVATVGVSIYKSGMNMSAKKKAESEGTHNISNRAIAEAEEEIGRADIKVVEEGENGRVEITNKHGATLLNVPNREARQPGEFNVIPVDSINDGLLWECGFVEGHRSVHINTSHPFYPKVYLANEDSPYVIQGLDALFWSLVKSELDNTSETVQKHFEDLRYECSRVLRRVVESIPEPDLDD